MLVVVGSVLTTLSASPAEAGETKKPCLGVSEVNVIGFTQKGDSGTFIPGQTIYHCGNLGVRAYQTSVGGGNWTAWRYSGYGNFGVTMKTYNATKSQHSTTLGRTQIWTTCRGDIC